MKKAMRLLLLSGMTVAALGGCKKEEYQPKGNYVTAGTNNNMVLNYSVTVTPGQWVYDNLYERFYFDFGLSANSNSVVHCYVMSGDGQQAMPYYFCPSWTCEQYDFATNLFMSPPYIRLQFTNWAAPTTKPGYDKFFYIVVVPPSAMEIHPDLDWSNYDEVKKTFNLKD